MFPQTYESHDPVVNEAVLRARQARSDAMHQALTALWRKVTSLFSRSSQPRHWGTLAHG